MQPLLCISASLYSHINRPLQARQPLTFNSEHNNIHSNGLNQTKVVRKHLPCLSNQLCLLYDLGGSWH